MNAGCPDDASWQSWFDGTVERDERAALLAHLNHCAPCCGFVAALNPDAAAIDAPRCIDRYQLAEPLGAGAMGMVFAALDPKLERRVAVKLLRTAGSADERAALSRRMWREACAMAQLSHPNVVAVYDVGVVDDGVFIVMELVAGQSLSAWCRAQVRTFDERVAVLVTAGQGLAAIHGAGLVHRDFKPDNVLIDQAGRARVTDFGVAAAVGDLAEPDPAAGPTPTLLDRLTLTRSLVGTPAYMAPEQLDGHKADARSDQFSFCVALYECLFEARPFSGATVVELRAAIEAGALRDPAPRDREARRLFAVVRRGLAVDPSARFASMRELLEQLRPRRRATRGWLLPAVAAVALVAGGSAYRFGREPGSSSSVVALTSHGPRPAIAVLGVRALGRAGDHAWIGPVVAELLISGLASDDVRLARGDDVARSRAEGAIPAVGQLPTTAAALERARTTLAVDLFLVGSCEVTGATLRLRLALHDARSGALRWQDVEDGPILELSSSVARATARIRRQLQVATADRGPGSAPSGTLPTEPVALRAYVEGLEALRRSDYVVAGNHLTAAAGLAPDSAAVQLALAEVHDMSGQYQRRQEALARAFERSRNASREQQLAVEARYRAALGESAKAVELYRSLTTFFPDDPGYGYQLVRAELALGAPGGGLAVITRLRQQPGRAEDPWLDELEGTVRRELGDLDGAERVLLAGIAHADRAMARTAQARSLRALGWVHIQRGQIAEALVWARQTIEVAGASGDRLNLAHGLELAGRAELFLGDLAAAEAHLREMAKVLDELTFRTGFGYNLLARVQLERGDVEAATATLEVGLGMATAKLNDLGTAALLLPAIDLALLTGRVGEAERLLERLRQLDEHSTSPLSAARYRWKRAAVLAAHDDRVGATTALSDALALIEFTPSYAAELRIDLAALALAEHSWQRAATEATAAARVFAAMGARDLEARAQAVLARAQTGRGARAAADAALARALDLAAVSESPLTRLAVELAHGRVLEQRGGAERRRGQALIATASASARRLGLDGLADPASPAPR